MLVDPSISAGIFSLEAIEKGIRKYVHPVSSSTDSSPMVFSYGTAGFRLEAQYLESVCFRIGVFVVLLSCIQATKHDQDFINSAAGVMITASHNQEIDNGLKIIGQDGGMLSLIYEPIASLFANIPASQFITKALFSLLLQYGIIKNNEFTILTSNSTKTTSAATTLTPPMIDIEYKIKHWIHTIKPIIFLGQDTRASSPLLLSILQEGIIACGGVIVNYSVIPTPQLHWIIGAFNTKAKFKLDQTKHAQIVDMVLDEVGEEHDNKPRDKVEGRDEDEAQLLDDMEHSGKDDSLSSNTTKPFLAKIRGKEHQDSQDNQDSQNKQDKDIMNLKDAKNCKLKTTQRIHQQQKQRILSELTSSSFPAVREYYQELLQNYHLCYMLAQNRLNNKGCDKDEDNIDDKAHGGSIKIKNTIYFDCSNGVGSIAIQEVGNLASMIQLYSPNYLPSSTVDTLNLIMNMNTNTNATNPTNASLKTSIPFPIHLFPFNTSYQSDSLDAILDQEKEKWDKKQQGRHENSENNMVDNSLDSIDCIKFPIDLPHDRILNQACGAEFVHRQRVFPKRFLSLYRLRLAKQENHSNTLSSIKSNPAWLIATLDGDADRLVLFTTKIADVEVDNAKDVSKIQQAQEKKHEKQHVLKPMVFDGDRLSCVFTAYLSQILTKIKQISSKLSQTLHQNSQNNQQSQSSRNSLKNLPTSTTLPNNPNTSVNILLNAFTQMKKITLGVVQTAYTNGAATNYISNLSNCEVVCAKTGVKYLHYEALQFDIGIYFEANGHGTALFSHTIRTTIISLRNTLEDILLSGMYTTYAENQALYSNYIKLYLLILELQAFIDIINEFIGDAVADFFAFHVAFYALQWDLEEWNGLYSDYPNVMDKVIVKDRNIITTSDAERRCETPYGLQQCIDKLVADYEHTYNLTTEHHQMIRTFVRPSGTEDIVRVYAEGPTLEITRQLCQDVCKLVKEYCS